MIPVGLEWTDLSYLLTEAGVFQWSSRRLRVSAEGPDEDLNPPVYDSSSRPDHNKHNIIRKQPTASQLASVKAFVADIYQTVVL